ncbi:MAG: alpha-1,2-fucosyltransferase [Bacteroidales bacterium]
MKIVQIVGGLGNQMFQYALAIVLKEKFQEEVLIDTCPFNGYPLFNGFEIDKVFEISPLIATKKEIKRVYYPFVNRWLYYRIYKHLMPKLRNEFKEIVAEQFDPDVLIRLGDCYYDGYWQDYRYFEGYEEIIRKAFTYKLSLSEISIQCAKLLEKDNFVSIHVRKGDYDTDKTFGGLCDLDYYEKAISEAKKRLGIEIKFAIFSNNIQWCKENLIPLIGEDNVLFVDWNRGADSYNDMRLMSLCKGNILANSSFSWWGAFLNVHNKPLVIAPKLWARGSACKRQMPEWILIDNTDKKQVSKT